MANRRFIDFPIASTVGDNDIVLIWQDGANKQTTKATILSGLPENLEDLNDVVISGLTNGQILRYDSVTGKWENTDQGNLDLNDLNDVSIVSPSNGQVLVYNSSTSKWENSSGGFVPYVGAVTTVDLGAQGLRAGYVRFDTSVASVPDEQGLMYWDASRSTAALIMNGTLQHIGQDTFFYVKNSSGSNIPKGTCVRFAGTDGASGHLLIAPFLANGSVPSSYFMGVTAEAIANGSFGQVMHFGELEGINTSGFTAGALLYASTTVAGGFQTTVPVAPNNIVLVAAAVNSKNNGAIIVRPQIGSNINNDEGVKITSPTTGDLLQLQAGGLWENKTIDGAGIVTKATSQVISGLKTFNVNTLMMQSSGNANAVYLSNSSGSSTYQSGFNFFGFNTDNHIYFAKSSITGGNTGILAWTNTATRTYTLKDASGTLAFTSDIPANPVGGTGTTNYLPKFTGTSTIGNSALQETSGNLGLGVTPSAWSLLTAMQIKGGAFISGYNNNTYVGANWYFDGSVGRYLNNDFATSYIQTDGEHQWLSATSGTAGNAISFTQAMTLNASGNLGLGVTPSAWDNSVFRGIQIGSNAPAFLLGRTDSFANVQLGVNGFFDGSWKYVSSNFATRYYQTAGFHAWEIAPSGTAGNAITWSTPMTLTSGGNLLVGTTSDNGARLQVSGTATLTNLLVGTSATQNGRATIATSSDEYLDIVNTTEVNTKATGIRFGNYSVTDGFKKAGIFYQSVGDGASRGDLIIALNTAFNTNNVTPANAVMTFKGTSGNVGIGTSSPGLRLHVSTTAAEVLRLQGTSGGSTNNTQLRFFGSNANTDLWAIGSEVATGSTDRAFDFYDLVANQNRLRITSSGNVGIGTTTASSALSGSARVLAIVDNSTANVGSVRVYGGGTLTSLELYGSADQVGLFGSTNNPMVFWTNSTERMRITAGGEVLIGNTDNGAYNLQCNGTGVWGAGAYVNGSDRNIKDNIATIEKGLEYIQKMNPVKFRYKPNYTRDHSMQTGFIAQELQEVFASEDYLSGLVQKGVHLSVAYQNLLPVLVKAIQELKQEIDTLKN